MSDIAEGWEQDDDWQDVDYWDDETSYVKEEPDCYSCNDSGLIFDFDRETGRRCKACQPGRVRRWWWMLKFHVGWWWSFHRPFRKRHPRAVDEDGPF